MLIVTNFIPSFRTLIEADSIADRTISGREDARLRARSGARHDAARLRDAGEAIYKWFDQAAPGWAVQKTTPSGKTDYEWHILAAVQARGKGLREGTPEFQKFVDEDYQRRLEELEKIKRPQLRGEINRYLDYFRGARAVGGVLHRREGRGGVGAEGGAGGGRGVDCGQRRVGRTTVANSGWARSVGTPGFGRCKHLPNGKSGPRSRRGPCAPSQCHWRGPLATTLMPRRGLEPLRPFHQAPAPQAGASANFATSALGADIIEYDGRAAKDAAWGPRGARASFGAMKTRTETDTMGEIEVAADRYWGAQTAALARRTSRSAARACRPRSSGRSAIVKKAAAQVNTDLELLPPEKRGPDREGRRTRSSTASSTTTSRSSSGRPAAARRRT